MPLKVALPNVEKQVLLELGKELDLSEKQIVRLTIIWLAYVIKYEAITRIHKCQRFAFDKIAEQWNRENQSKPPNPQVSKLKDSGGIEKEICILLSEAVYIDLTRSAFQNNWKTLFGVMKKIVVKTTLSSMYIVLQILMLGKYRYLQSCSFIVLPISKL